MKSKKCTKDSRRVRVGERSIISEPYSFTESESSILLLLLLHVLSVNAQKLPK